jgi:hypothetical protein
MKKSIFFLLLALPIFLKAQFPVEKIKQAYQALVDDQQAKYAITSLCILDAQTGNTIFAHNENIGLATASTLKTITSATAYSVLGKDFKYQTTLAYSGKITANGTLEGDLIILGGGDPTLGSWRYEQTKENVILTNWVSAIKDAGIKKINGAVIGDDSLFGTQSVPEGWIWQDMGNYYGAGTSTDLTYTDTEWFGVRCDYTATRSNGFIFDDFTVSELNPDITPPTLLSAKALDEFNIEAVFSEKLELNSALIKNNYTLSNLGNPLMINQTTLPNVYKLTFASPLVSGAYSLMVTNVKDVKGNVIDGNNKVEFFYIKPYLAQIGDVVINEIFADPTIILVTVVPDCRYKS